ncbi:SMC-Scp complex subunit ScpB [Pseudoleptotrichia goodfellowii]|jgi:segregation and condensation protein B|uniref:Segregation and condensation protein B n=2 Tax=Pseudoleptotrichia goodfellowii TaxID=157692 RepID=D0GML0_9FUSO|nr:SMC-Scp complex subunit ScpB [Pseudoleptotrichia goodfellowii]EEY34672.1 segregation and condensation protein B [Pseudoleptotrichia goodfellowii F0264]MBF4805747.1 SMC-Scp complex subunit ScpB [Pseudoleptotrichia goodfellowii]BBM35275.1 segregation and condensation protein B [Pseudoleptotrichia goodfellowii]
MDINENLEDRVETIVFLSKEQLTVEELAKFYEIELSKMEEILLNLKEKRKTSGINVKIENGMIMLVSNPLYGEDVKRFFNPEMKIKKLTRSTMETLAIIAYKGPITKTEIEQIRGVSVEKTMANLLEKNLVYISGKKKTIGTPNLYEVTEDFYSYLSINDKTELPGFEQYEKIELLYKMKEEENGEIPESIMEKLEKKAETEVEDETE